MITLQGIDVSFRSERQDSFFAKSRQQILFGVDMTVKQGSCLGILGESGSGKSTTGRVLCGLLKPDKGTYLLQGVDVYGSKQGKKALQQCISVVFQDYTTSANPRFQVKDIIGEGVTIYQRRAKHAVDKEQEVAALLNQVGLDQSYGNRYPHELSGGQLQRVCIARAIACRPQIILFDEAISSLDAHTQVQIMDLLQEIKQQFGYTYIFITHDLTAITYLCDEVMFLYRGKVTAQVKVEELSNVQDEYARKLLHSIIDFQK